MLERHALDDYRPAVITLTDRVLTLGDGPAWELARYFVLQGPSYLLVLVFHPRPHFPGYVIKAVTQTALITVTVTRA